MSAMIPQNIHSADQIGDVEVFTDEDGESYLAIGVGDKLKIRPLKYEQEAEFQEYTLPAQIAGVTAVHCGGKTLPQLLIITTHAHIYSLHAHHLNQLWSKDLTFSRRTFDMAWENMSENEDYLVVFFGSRTIGFELRLSDNIVSSITPDYFSSSFPSGALRLNGKCFLRKMACETEIYVCLSDSFEFREYALHCVPLESAFVFICQTDLVLACPNLEFEILPQDEGRLEVVRGLVIYPKVHETHRLYKDSAICHVKLDDQRVLMCCDGELLLLCVEIDSRKMAANSASTLKQFEVFSLSRFTPAKWIVRVEQNLFLAISTEYDSFYFQLSSHKPFYKVVSFCDFSSALPITHLEVFQEARKSGPWKVESHSLLYSQGELRRSLLVLEEKCIQAQEVLLTQFTSDDVYHSLWGCGGDWLMIEGRVTKACFRVKRPSAQPRKLGLMNRISKKICLRKKKNTSMTQFRDLRLIDKILHAADDKVLTPNSIFCFQSTGKMKAITLKKSASWGKICKGCVVLVTCDGELECYDEKLDLVYREKLASEYIFFQAERNNGAILFIAANYKGVVECRVVDLDTTQCSSTQQEIGKIPNSGIIEPNDDDFTIYLGCEQGCITVFTLSTEHQSELQSITLTTSEELLIVHLSAPSHIVVRTCTETFIVFINLELKICELSAVPSLRNAQSMTNTSEGLVVLDDDNRLRLIHLAETSTNQVHCVPLKGKIETFSTILKGHHHHLVGIVFSWPEKPMSLIVVDIRTKRRSPTVFVPKAEREGLELYPFLKEEDKPTCFIVHSDSTKYLCHLMPNCTVQVKKLFNRSTPKKEELAAAKIKQLSTWLTGNSSSLKAGFNRAAHVERLLDRKIFCPMIFHNISLTKVGGGFDLHRVSRHFQVSKEYFKSTEKANALTTDVFSSPQVFFIGTKSGNIYRYSLRD